MPSIYSRPTFYIIQMLLAFVAGGLAVAYQINQPILAFNIGAVTKLIIGKSTRIKFF